VSDHDRAGVEMVKRSLVDLWALLVGLGLTTRAKKGAGGYWILCPWHSEGSPSCHVRPGPDRTVQVKCFGCADGSGDVFSLIAAAHHLVLPVDFPKALEIGAGIAGVDLAEVSRNPPPPPPRVPPPPPKPHLPEAEARAFWDRCVPVTQDEGVLAWIIARGGIDHAQVASLDLARALPEGAPCPTWATYKGDAATPSPWPDLGYRCIVPMYDRLGALRGVRARLVIAAPRDYPKALPPTGYGVSGLVMASPLAVSMLASAHWPKGSPPPRLVVAEGEPDYLTWATRTTTDAVLGLGGNGQWTEGIAHRIPAKTKVLIRTDRDDAGDAYAEEIATTIGPRCTVWESDPEDRAERRRTKPERDAERRRQAHQTAIPTVR
jgi:hypothetical protein